MIVCFIYESTTTLGLLYSRSNHRLMIEFLLAELSRKPTSECCDTREAMTLAAAWALGMWIYDEYLSLKLVLYFRYGAVGLQC